MKYYIIAGEASGDLYGSNLIKEVLKLDPNANIRGWGGDLMEKAGVNIVKHYKNHNYMGFLEVLRNLKTILNNLNFCKSDIKNFKPDALILIDFPGFNMRIAKYFYQSSFPVMYYIAPQVWAWKENRVEAIKKYVDQLYVILPFEKTFFKNHEIDSNYFGHPLLEHVLDFQKHNSDSRKVFFEKYGLNKNKNIISLLPGSRKQEIIKKLPIMLASLSSDKKDINIVVAGMNNFETLYQQLINDYDVKVIYDDTYNILNNSNIALVTSGTATLETAFFKIPQVVCYKSSWFSYSIAKSFIKVKYISLVNLILNKLCVKELIQNDLNKFNLSKELIKLKKEDYKESIKKDYSKLIEKCSGIDVSKNIANSMLKTIETF
jgi:lipid-A-disaccharide synthase